MLVTLSLASTEMAGMALFIGNWEEVAEISNMASGDSVHFCLNTCLYYGESLTDMGTHNRGKICRNKRLNESLILNNAIWTNDYFTIGIGRGYL